MFSLATFIDNSPGVVGDLACDQNNLAWTSKASIDPADRSPMTQIWVSDIQAKAPRKVVSARHGGLVGLMQISGEWLVFVEYQQLEQSNKAQFWYIRAHNLTTGQERELAHATQAPGTLAVPFPAISAPLVVWDEMASSTQKVLKAFDLRSGAVQTLALPSSVYPLAPLTDGTVVLFLDNATDPNRASETWLSYGGRLTRYDLTSHNLQQLDSADDARQPRLAGSWVVWLATVRNPDGSTDPAVRATRIGGGAARVISDRGYDAHASPGYALWWDPIRQKTMVYAFASGHSTGLPQPTVAGSGLTLCGASVFYSSGPRSIGVISLPADL